MSSFVPILLPILLSLIGLPEATILEDVRRLDSSVNPHPQLRHERRPQQTEAETSPSSGEPHNDDHEGVPTPSPAFRFPAFDEAVRVSGHQLHFSGYSWFLVSLIPVMLWAASDNTAPIHVVVFAWVVDGILMNVVNKIVAVTFNAPLLLVMLQMSFGMVWILAFERTRARFEKWRDVFMWMVVPFSFSAVLTSSLFALQLASLSTVIVIRHVVPIFLFLIESTCLSTGGRASSAAIFPLCMMLVGVIVFTYDSTDGGNDGMRAMSLVLLNAVMCTIDRLVQSHILKRPDFGASISCCALMNNSGGFFFGRLGCDRQRRNSHLV